MCQLLQTLDRVRPDRAGGGVCLTLLLAGLLSGLAQSAAGADLSAARSLFVAGQYADAAVAAEGALRDRRDAEEWSLLLAESLTAMGRYAEAYSAITNGLAREPGSVRLRWLAGEVFPFNGQAAKAAGMVRDITRLVPSRPYAYRSVPDLIVYGQAALRAGADPKRVLERVFEAAKKVELNAREVYLAGGELALEKHDFALAAKWFQEGLQKLPDDPDLHFGLARAYAPSQPAAMLASLEEALKRNTNHIGSLLLLADHQIDAEDYDEATQTLGRVRAVNPRHPEAWAYLAVIAHLRSRPAEEQAARAMALKFWPANPRVPHLIGRKLSQKYRFAEGAALQRQALQFDPDYLPAKAQLSEDLLRLGQEAEGWKLAEEVQLKDGYDVTALNLVTLHDTLAKFATLTNDHFVVRMSPAEAALYGARALELLEQARTRLGAKYGLELPRPVHVEIFAEQKDFAVRTFGMPENNGFLGVCFGNVITANSPATRPGHPFNWESMLWHEFTHVITLTLTRNKMPRWLSEGISVYEERQANPAWGEHLLPKYRQMILDGELTPVAHLSGAFLTPSSAAQLQFAYYESSLVVEFLVERFGAEALRAILHDLGDGAETNQAIAKHTASMAEIEKAFAAFARQKAEALAPGLDWEKPALEAMLGGAEDLAWTVWAKPRPNNFYVLMRQGEHLMEAQNWAAAVPVWQRLVDLYPDFTGPDSAYRPLAEAYQHLGRTNEERQAWVRLAEKDDEAVDAYLRSMQLAAAAGDWPAVILNARRYIAVNPLVAPPYRFLAEASEATGDAAEAIGAYRALLQLDPPNPAEVHFRLARQLHRVGDPAARRQMLLALEDAPRYRDALRLLLEIDAAVAPAATAAVETPEASR